MSYTGTEVKNSKRTKKIETIKPAEGIEWTIYSHTLPVMAGSYVVVWGEYEWTAYESLEEARDAVDYMDERKSVPTPF